MTPSERLILRTYNDSLVVVKSTRTEGGGFATWSEYRWPMQAAYAVAEKLGLDIHRVRAVVGLVPGSEAA